MVLIVFVLRIMVLALGLGLGDFSLGDLCLGLGGLCLQSINQFNSL